MLAADLDPGSPFYSAIDEARLGMSGHSFGGFTTYLVISLDARFITAMPLAPAVPGMPVLDVPSLTMLGALVMELAVTPILCLWLGRVARQHRTLPTGTVEAR